MGCVQMWHTVALVLSLLILRVSKVKRTKCAVWCLQGDLGYNSSSRLVYIFGDSKVRFKTAETALSCINCNRVGSGEGHLCIAALLLPDLYRKLP
jgi:hypothetical protein